MKNYILFLILITASVTINAQTTWTGNGADTNWNTTDNWDSNSIPTAADDVIIPTGFTVTLNVAGSIESMDLQGNSVFEMNANLTFTDPSTFGVNTTVNWATGNLNGTTSNLTNLGTINLTTTGAHFISGGTTLDNQGTINFTGTGDLLINQDSVLNNPIGGIIDMQADGGNIAFNVGPVGVINNVGLIKKTTSSGEAVIIIPINNNDGTIQVEVGILSFQGTGKNFIDGTFNVFAGATMDWDTTIDPSGTLSGTVVGDLNWNNIVNVVDGTFAAFNFTAADNFNWTSGTLSGGGTLTNTNVLKLTTTSFHRILGGTTLDNQGILNLTSSGDLLINENSVLNNPIDGIIDLQADSANIAWNSGVAGVINNAGLITRTTTTGLVQIFLELNNSGTIEVVSGELEHTGSFPFTNEVTGIIKGIGIFDLPTVANYTNNGTFEPGLSPGTLSVQGDYTSTVSSVLDIELDGLTPDTEYDVLAITGNNNIFEGSVNITLGFDADENDTFDIATTTGTIITQNLVSPIIVEQDGKRYTFGVTYPNDDIVRLTITEKLDIQVPDVITQNITVQLDASGNVSITTAQIDNGSTDNCTLVPNLVYGLDITSFTCADLGANTVMLTVTDEANNFATLPATVTVEDSVLPTVITQNVTVQLDASGNASITTGDIDDGSNDNCTVDTLSLDVTTFTCADLGANTVNLTVTDQSGNSDSLAATVTVEDGISPVITCPANFSVDSDGSFTLPNYYDLGNVTATDNCAVDTVVQSPVAGTVLEDGDHLISYTVTDTSGNTHNCLFTLNVNDTTLSADAFELSGYDILAFPNPTNGKITLKLNKNISEIDIAISNILGQVISNERFVNTNTVNLNIDGSPGIYFVSIKISEGNSKIIKVLKK